MKRLCKILIVVGVVAALAGMVGCGTVANGSSSMTAQEILTKAVDAAKTTQATSGKTTFDLSLSLQLDKTNTQTTIPQALADMASQPMKLSGTVAWASQPQAADMTFKAVIGGKTTDISARVVDKKLYIGFLGKWYDAGVQAAQSAGATSTTQLDASKLLAKLTPTSWLKSPTVTKETVNGTDTYHISGAVDVAALVADVSKLAADPEFKALGSSLSGVLGSGDTTQTTMSQADITKLVQEFQVFKIDLWVASKDYKLVKSGIDLTMAPPTGQDNQGLKSISLSGTVTSSADKFVTVTAPAGALSIQQLYTALMQDPNLKSIMQTLGASTGTSGSLK